MYKRKYLLSGLLLLVVFGLTSCDKDKNEPENSTQEPAFISFTFDGIAGTSIIDKTAKTVIAQAGSTVDLTKIAPVFQLSPTGAVAKVNGAVQTSGVTRNDFTGTVTYTITSGDKTATWKVIITRQSGTTDHSFTIKSGKIFYDWFDAGGTHIATRLIFDDYGKRMRFEEDVEGGGCTVIITDEIAQEAYVFVLDAGTEKVYFTDMYPCNANQITYTFSRYGVNGPYWTKKEDKIVAGKSCIFGVMGDESDWIELAGWNNILFYSKTNTGEGFQVTSFVDYSPASAEFLPPPGYVGY